MCEFGIENVIDWKATLSVPCAYMPSNEQGETFWFGRDVKNFVRRHNHEKTH